MLKAGVPTAQNIIFLCIVPFSDCYHNIVFHLVYIFPVFSDGIFKGR